MTPMAVKKFALSGECSCKACTAIAKQDLYINVPKPQLTGEGKITTARWADRPCKCGCGKTIKPGSEVWWPNWGIYILDHARNEGLLK